jgi:phosphate transport system substrate-binding protein
VKKFIALSLALFLVIALSMPLMAAKQKINGAGASFPYPVYSQWAYKFKNLTGHQINYQSIGSGGGIAQIKAKTVHFGGTDAPLKPDELEKHGLVQFPMVMGGVVPVINIKGVKAGALKLTPSVMADIFLGKIKKWNDSAIQKLNSGVELPDKDITVVHRADGSGTTWIFTNYLMKVSPEWKEKIGFGKAVDWPTGIGGKGNEGVATYVKRTDGSIGYVEFAYALQNDMSYAMLENREGHFVSPTIETFQAAAANADWQSAKGYYLVLTNQPGEKSWPITGATFILIYKEQKDAELAKAMLEYFDWCFHHGGDVAEELHYVPMPESVVKMVEKTWSKNIKAADKQIWKPKLKK